MAVFDPTLTWSTRQAPRQIPEIFIGIGVHFVDNPLAYPWIFPELEKALVAIGRVLFHVPFASALSLPLFVTSSPRRETHTGYSPRLATSANVGRAQQSPTVDLTQDRRGNPLCREEIRMFNRESALGLPVGKEIIVTTTPNIEGRAITGYYGIVSREAIFGGNHLQ